MVMVRGFLSTVCRQLCMGIIVSSMLISRFRNAGSIKKSHCESCFRASPLSLRSALLLPLFAIL